MQSTFFSLVFLSRIKNTHTHTHAQQKKNFHLWKRSSTELISQMFYDFSRDRVGIERATVASNVNGNRLLINYWRIGCLLAIHLLTHQSFAGHFINIEKRWDTCHTLTINEAIKMLCEWNLLKPSASQTCLPQTGAICMRFELAEKFILLAHCIIR